MDEKIKILSILVDFNEKESQRLTSLRKQKQKERAEHLQDLKIRFPLGPNQLSIVNLPFEKLVQKLQNRELKAREVLEAFIAKAVQVTTEFNCVTEFIPQSLVSLKNPSHAYGQRCRPKIILL